MTKIKGFDANLKVRSTRSWRLQDFSAASEAVPLQSLAGCGKIRLKVVLKGRTFRAPLEVLLICHPEPASAGEGSAVPTFSAARQRLIRVSWQVVKPYSVPQV